MTQASLAELRAPSAQAGQIVQVGFDTTSGFEALQRMAKMFNNSSIVPQRFQGEGNIGSAAIALDMAIRMRANPLMVMQNLYTVHGSPAWSAQFLIATLNQSGKFSALRYEFQGTEGNDDWGCRAVVTELSSNEKLSGPLVTIGLAKKEGWYAKNGSKWQSMPELMLRYRAASWFVRSYAPEIAMGLPTAEEARDTIDVVQGQDGTYSVDLASIAATDPTPQASHIAEKPKPNPRVKSKETITEQQQTTTAPEIAETSEQTVESIWCPKEAETTSDKQEQYVYATFCETCPDRHNCPSWT